MEAKDRLQKKINKAFLYKGNQIVISNYNFRTDKVEILTDKGWKDIPINDIDEFIDELEPVSNEVGFVMPQMHIANNNSMTKLKELIFQNIDKIHADANYVPQAQAVNDQVKSFIDLAKLEVEMVKIIKGK